jgi:recombination protein RecA
MSLATFRKKIDKIAGERIIYGEDPEMKVTSTGSITLDYATGIGGFPAGRVYEMYGAEGVGKTSLSYYMMREHQKKNRACCFINLEGSYDPAWARRIAGLNTDSESYLALHPTPGKEAVQLLAEAVHSGEFGIVVYDSIGAMIGDKEATPGEEKQAGGQSALVTHLTKLVAVPAERTNTTVVLINQVRDIFSSAPGSAFKVGTPGGRAVKHFAAMRLWLRQAKWDGVPTIEILGNKVPVGHRVNFTIQKNKVAAANVTAGYNFFGRPWNNKIGIDTQQELIDLALNTKIIKGAGYYEHPTFPGKLHGAASVTEFLESNPEAFEQIKIELMEHTQAQRIENVKGEDYATA